MENNGKISCDFCNLEIKRYDGHVRLPRPQIAGNTQAFAHFHRRDNSDCWQKAVARAKARKEAAKPTPSDFSEYEKWLANRDAKRSLTT